MDRFLIPSKRPRTSETQKNTNPPLPEAEEEDINSRQLPVDAEVQDREGEPLSADPPDEQLAAASCSTTTAISGIPNVSTAATASCSSSRTPAGPADLSQSAVEGPRRPVLKNYPGKKNGLQVRFFNRRWYEDYNWLEYSISKDSAFCFACRHFSRPGLAHTETAFTHGYQNWRKATASFKTHNASAGHKYSMDAWAEFNIRKEAGSKISNALSDGHLKTVRENREYMRAVVESLRFTACQTVAQRGHREDENSNNRGNFIELLNVIGKFDKTVAQKISDNPRNAKYTHHDVQNELIEIMANMVREQISSEIEEAGLFALIVDESKDVSKKEQVSVVARYLHNDAALEEFLHFTPADGLDADSLLKTIKLTLNKCNIDHNTCVAQCYDGAAVMSGCHNGVAEKFRKDVPQALYIHCHAHRLNLVLVDCVKNIQPAAEFFESVQVLYKFFSGSVPHDLFLKKQKEIEPTQAPVELKRLSETRWACQYSALWAIQKTLPAIRATLLDILGQSNARRKIEARGVYALIDCQFTLQLTLFEDLFRVTKFLSDHLQSPDLELASATDLVQSVITTLAEKRSEESWNDIWDRALAQCTKAGIPAQQQRQDRRQAQQPRHLQDFVVDAQTGDRPPSETPDDLRKHCFYPVIDRLLSEMKRRFSPESCNVLRGTSALSPKQTSFLDMQSLSPMAHHYGITDENLSAELHQVRRLLDRKKEQGHTVSTTLEFLSILRPYKDAFIDLYRLLCISVTLPVTSATCERSFSCLRLVKNYMRSNSGDSRNSNLALLAINSRRAKALDVQDIIDSFAMNHNNRRIILL